MFDGMSKILAWLEGYSQPEDDDWQEPQDETPQNRKKASHKKGKTPASTTDITSKVEFIFPERGKAPVKITQPNVAKEKYKDVMDQAKKMKQDMEKYRGFEEESS